MIYIVQIGWLIYFKATILWKFIKKLLYFLHFMLFREVFGII